MCRSVVLFLILAALVNTSWGCFCIAMADESKICQADFAVKVTVLKADPVNIQIPVRNVTIYAMSNSTVGVIRYVVYVEDVFKISRTLVAHVKPKSRNVTIMSPSDNKCNVVDDLETDGQYYVTGNVYEGLPGIFRCTSVVAKYREGEDAPYTDKDMKVDVNRKCPGDEDNTAFMRIDSFEDYDSGDVDGGASAQGSKLGLLSWLTATAVFLFSAYH